MKGTEACVLPDVFPLESPGLVVTLHEMQCHLTGGPLILALQVPVIIYTLCLSKSLVLENNDFCKAFPKLFLQLVTCPFIEFLSIIKTQSFAFSRYPE